VLSENEKLLEWQNGLPALKGLKLANFPSHLCVGIPQSLFKLFLFNCQGVHLIAMGPDTDIMLLAWLNRQPAGFAYADVIPGGARETLNSLQARGLISLVPSKQPEGRDGYVITPAGKKFQEGD
jgi:hypothetical protein